jgi:hypothetical protein
MAIGKQLQANMFLIAASTGQSDLEPPDQTNMENCEFQNA